MQFDGQNNRITLLTWWPKVHMAPEKSPAEKAGLEEFKEGINP